MTANYFTHSARTAFRALGYSCFCFRQVSGFQSDGIGGSAAAAEKARAQVYQLQELFDVWQSKAQFFLPIPGVYICCPFLDGTLSTVVMSL